MWIDFYNFDNATIFVITSEVTPNESTIGLVNKSIHNINEYLEHNQIPIEVGKEIYLRDFLVIEHVIPIYWNETQRLLLTKKLFKYYKDLRLIFFYSHKIILNFTIIGSNGDESLQLFNNDLCINNGIFNDTYIEFDQSNYEINGFEKLVDMLGKKCRTGLIEASKKQSDITVMRGSNDIVDPFIYIQIQEQYTPYQYKLYISSKTIPQLGIFNFEIIDYCKKINDEDINISNFEEAKIIFNYQYNNSMQKNFRMAIATISFVGFSSNMVKNILEKTEEANISLAHEVEVEMFIRRNITNLITLTQDTFLINPKVQENNGNITNINEIKDYNNVKFENIDISIRNRASQLIDYFNSGNINILEEIIYYCSYSA